jgi:hypothetical protein
MDCEACRQALAAEPQGGFPGGAEHLARCAACRAYAEELRAFDARIARALAVDVPPLALPALDDPADGSVDGETPARVTPLAAHRRPRLRLPALLAAAAGFAAVAVLVLRALGPEAGGYERLASELLAHMDHEQSSRVVTSVAVADSALGEVLEDKVRAFDTGGSIVSYATSCEINGKLVPHLVVQGHSGPITVILLPEENVDEIVPLSGEHVHGFILPADSGSVAVIGEREEQMPEVDRLGERVVQSVKWSI